MSKREKKKTLRIKYEKEGTKAITVKVELMGKLIRSKFWRYAQTPQ